MHDPQESENRLLAALPGDEYRRLEPHLERRTASLKQVLQEPGSQVHEVQFPVDSVISILNQMRDGPNVEVATIGNEGLFGLPVALGADAMNPREVATVPVPGEVIALGSAPFLEELAREGALAGLVRRYTQAFLSQVAQQVACNGLHLVEQRCARWLLLTHDRVGTDEFPMTQEFLAQMLGVRRATVTVATGGLQRAGFVEFRRGRLRVGDREGLEGAACECYGAIREVFDRLVP